MNIPKSIAKILLQEKAVFLRPQDPFTWTSGIKSPVYCDNRLLISTVEARSQIVRAFCDEIRKLNVDVVAGTATAGIPWAAWIAMELKLPMVYVRSSSKEHGRKNAIEGSLKEKARVILIEDLISTGKSSIAAARHLQEAGAEVEVVFSLFTYGFNEASEVFKAAGLRAQSLTTFEVLASVAYDEKMVNEEDLKHVLEWRKSVAFP
jgi:orotate phosphoribosyltransferase